MANVPAGSHWKIVGIFGVVGPYVGGLIVGLVGLSSGFGGLVSGPPTIGDASAVLLWGLAGYPFGIIPAVLTGLVAAVSSSKTPSNIAWLAICTFTGAAISAAFVALVFAVGDGFIFYAGIGAAAAAASALVALRVRSRRSN